MLVTPLNSCPIWFMHYYKEKLGTDQVLLHATGSKIMYQPQCSSSSPKDQRKSLQNYTTHPESPHPPLKLSGLEEHSKDCISHYHATCFRMGADEGNIQIALGLMFLQVKGSHHHGTWVGEGS